MKKFKCVVLVLLFMQIGWTQEDPIVFIEYDKQMRVQDIGDLIEVSFGLQASDNVPCMYDFQIFNLVSNENGPEFLKFKELKDKLIDFDPKAHTIYTMDSLSKLDYCEQNLLIADTRKLFLLRKINGEYYRYILQFISSSRGRTRVNTH